MKYIIAFTIVFFSTWLMYRSCTKGYDNYAYVVHVENELLFNRPLSDTDPNIIFHGRRLLQDILLIDQKVDKDDGAIKGRVRWYVCRGIDCDEGWQDSFYK